MAQRSAWAEVIVGAGRSSSSFCSSPIFRGSESSLTLDGGVGGSSRAGQKECYEVVGLQHELSGVLVVASGWPPPVRYAPGTFTCWVHM